MMTKELRKELSQDRWDEISARIQDQNLTLITRVALRFKLFLDEEGIIQVPGVQIPAWRTIVSFPDIYAPGEKERIQSGYFIHEQGRVCNISSDWDNVIKYGLLAKKTQAQQSLLAGRGDAEFLHAAISTIDSVISYADRYQIKGLSSSIRYGAANFLEALQLFRILHFALWISNTYHNTIGRFDQYMWPYLQADMKNGVLNEHQALSLVEEFFISFNRDSDLYIGMQQGDNGQSIMLGGCDADGNCAVNALTHICLQASLNNRLIDPKINLRVDKNTPLSFYEFCTELTRQGLGFPQYSNDDVVIPSLVANGYTITDARNYTVAACWEFIIPGKGMDIPNIGAISLAAAVDESIRKHLVDCNEYCHLEDYVYKELVSCADEIEKSVSRLWLEPAPYQSVLMTDCLHNGYDISMGGTYNNYGVHGTGFSDAVDQLAAVKYYIYDKECINVSSFIEKLNESFQQDQQFANQLRTDAPKFGRDAYADPIADFLLDAFADSFYCRVNERGGIFRPGTGSAMYYVLHAKLLHTLSNGLMPNEYFPANFSPSLIVRETGPLSVIKAFARPGLRRVMNGGPLTLELHNTVFRNQEGLTKVAQLVRSFILLGGHQLQLNAINQETLLKAKENPEMYRNLIVRVWGWSGYFVQLDDQYKEQIIARTSHMIR